MRILGLYLILSVAVFGNFLGTALAEQTETLEPTQELVDNPLPDEFYKARVLDIQDEGEHENFGESKQVFQILKIKVLTGPEKNNEFELEYGTQFSVKDSQKLTKNEVFILGKSYRVDGSNFYFVADRYRLNNLWIIAIFFAALVILFAGKYGISSLIGLAISIAIITGFLVPKLLAGSNPLLVSLIGATLIILFSIYPAHGFSKRTTLAVISAVFSLIIALTISLIVVELLKLTGLGSESAYNLQFGPTANLNLRGILLGGIIIGALGVLDDITTTQVAAVEEIKRAKINLSPRDLYNRSMSVGREHIVSLINTLVLAYIGASLPLFIALNLSEIPSWVLINNEFFTEEIVRTLVGSIALILAVPISTLIAVAYFTKNPPKDLGHQK